MVGHGWWCVSEEMAIVTEGPLRSWEACEASRGRRCVKNLCIFQLCCGSETVLKMSIPFSKTPNMLYNFHTNIQAPYYTYIRVFIWTKHVQMWFSTWDMYIIYCLDDHYEMKSLALCWLCILFFYSSFSETNIETSTRNVHTESILEVLCFISEHAHVWVCCPLLLLFSVHV